MVLFITQDSNGDFTLKFQGKDCELNVRVPKDQIGQLATIQSADWAKGNCIQLGKCAGVDAFWAYDASYALVSVLVGQDEICGTL